MSPFSSLLMSLIFLILSGHPAFAVELTSKNLKSLVEEKNARVAASRMETRASREQEGFLGRSFLPSLHATWAEENFQIGSRPRQNAPSSSAEAKINLFRGGRDQAVHQLRNLETEKQEAREKRILAEELERVRSLYWGILAQKEEHRLLEETLKGNQKNLAAARARIRSGVATDSDRFEFEMKEVDLKQGLRYLSLEIQKKERLLALSMGLATGAKIVFSEPLDHHHQDQEDFEHSEEAHAFLTKESEIEATQKSLSADLRRRSWLPELEAFAAHHRYNQRVGSGGPDLPSSLQQENVYGLRLHFNLAAGLEDRRESAALRLQAEAQEKLTKLHMAEVEAEFTSELDELRLLHDQVHEADENIKRAQTYERLTQSEYRRGVKNSLDVLSSAEKLHLAHRRRIEIIRDYQIAKAHLLSKIGR